MFVPDTRLITKYLKWLEAFPEQHARAWGNLYKQCEEAAMCEATYWGVLTDCGVSVEPNPMLLESPNGQSPDFCCSKDGLRFYVEVTCIKIDTATRQTTLESGVSTFSKAQHYSNLNDAIFHECWDKRRQCSSVKHPCLLAIGTFHYATSVLCVARHHLENLFTSQPRIAFNIDTTAGRVSGDPYGITDLSTSVFLRPNADGKVFSARQSIAGLLVGGFGCRPVNVFGFLHPQAEYPFDSGLLSRIEFCRLLPGYEAGTFEVVWDHPDVE